MAKALTPDICVIGAGPAGLAVATGAAAYGAGVVLVDRMMPAHNVGHGDLATAALHAAARRTSALRAQRKSSSAEEETELDFKAVILGIGDIVTDAVPACSPERLATLGITFIQAEARFTGRRKLMAGETEIRARRYVLATGSVPVVPAIPGLEEVGYLTADTVFDLGRRPGHLVVIGGDVAALELAQTFRRLGSHVTLLAESVLPEVDPEMTAVVLRRLHEEGVTVRERIKINSVERRGKTGVKVRVESDGVSGEVDGSQLLVATGRTGRFDSLDPKRARVALKDGAVDVSAMLRTTNRRIYAVGDATGTRSREAALHQAELVLKGLLFRLPAKDRSLVPAVVRTDPEIAHVGLSEAQARRRHKRLSIVRWPYSENDWARAMKRTEGHIKLVADSKGRLLGVSIVGVNASEMIAIWSLALSKGLGLKEMGASIPVHATAGEIGKSAAMAYFRARAQRPFSRGIVRLLRMFG
ncbi:MAG: FAD-dependent oxidoreductase [Rhizobiaceae bacterium]|nr:FAD-dependent oxidoreductase [Rhizobiaceae bacterium]